MLKEQQTPSPSSSPFFLFPNPNPLIMRSSNIPSPMIHPPGFNPHSFLNPNPNPNPDYKLNPIPLLDFDPCASARTELIITNTTLLTASEHAGGCLTEVPVGPVVSSSPENSETSTPQILNDVAETKTESKKNSQMIHCEICNVMCNSEKLFSWHKQGKKHLKNMEKKLSVSSAIIQENDKIKKKQDLLQDAPSVESLFACNIPDLVLQEPQSSNSGTEQVEEKVNVSQLLWCEVCKVTCNSEQKLLQHNLGKTHLKNLKDSEKIKGVEKVGDLEEVKVQWCEVCKMDCSDNFSRHVKGRNHRKKLQESKKMTDLPSTPIDSVIKGEVVNSTSTPIDSVIKGEVVNSTRCELCGICCTSDYDLKRHLSGKRHKSVVDKTEKVNGHGAERRLEDMMDGEGKVVILEMGKRKANDSLASEEEADVKRMKMTKEEGASGASISCPVCNVTCTKVVDFRDHLASQEHSAMVMKQVKEGLSEDTSMIT